MRTRGLFPMAAAALLAAPLAAVPASATPPAGSAVAAAASPTWAAWLGCWRPIGEAGTPDGMVCVLPAEDAASVRIVTFDDGVMTEETLLHADGVARRVEEGGCVGTEQAAWSRDGRRIYLRTEMDCDGVRRESTGVLAMLSEGVWLDAQAMTVGDQHASRSIRYRAVRTEDVPAAIAALLPSRREMAQEAARLHAAAPLDTDAIIEASSVVAPPVVEALLAARGDEYALDARTLVQLEEAGVPASVIDMMIAVSYPQRFAVQPRDADMRPAGVPPVARYRADCLDPFYYPSMRYRSECAYLYGMSRYGFGLRYGYSPWGYDRFGWGFGYSPVIIVQPGPGGVRERDTVVRGQGYRQGGSGQSGTAQPRSRSDRGTSTSSSSPSTTSTGSSTSTTSTTSSGSSSSGSDSGRTARPRGGGDP